MFHKNSYRGSEQSPYNCQPRLRAQWPRPPPAKVAARVGWAAPQAGLRGAPPLPTLTVAPVWKGPWCASVVPRQSSCRGAGCGACAQTEQLLL